ncbi:BrnT family toxin [Cyanobacterium stanieri LEGE 03274]|uniref:BrnT family toxin n=1 Tax=Cyanobacterium stanieri LEGE 03274 TaxID=1828756 RepID=A0ABR9V8Y3_9CHRO|nr:BrnT family toxin [Cyanobacterium stanieri]MBE9223611.1 BrnT family toxin [Cyanobacterium stanieri LEGE 03274]
MICRWECQEAQFLWLDVRRVEINAKSEDEPRTMVIGKIKNKHWTAVITYRGDRLRIISVRRSKTKEISLYES